MLDTVVFSGDDVCCSVAFGTLVSVFVFSVMWSELLFFSGPSSKNVRSRIKDGANLLLQVTNKLTVTVAERVINVMITGNLDCCNLMLNGMYHG